MKLYVLCAAFCILACGCSRKERAHIVIESSSPLNFSLWRSKVGAELSREEWTIFDVALQEIRYEAMAAGFTGSSGIDAAVRTLIDGKTIDYVVQRGLTRKLNRYIAERDEQRALIDRQKPLGSLEDTDDNAEVARSVRAAQLARYEKILEEVDKIEVQMASIEKSFHDLP